MSDNDSNDGGVSLTNVVESVGAYAVIYVDLSAVGRFPLGFGEMRDDIDRPFWNLRGNADDAIFGNTDPLREVVMDHFTPNDDSVYKIPWETDTVLAVLLWDDQNDEYMPVKMGDGVTVDLEDDFGSSHNHKARVKRLRGHRGDRATTVKVEAVEGDGSTWVNPMQIRSVYEDGPSWSRAEDGHELTPDE